MSAEFAALRGDIKRIASVIPALLDIINASRANEAKAIADRDAALSLAHQQEEANAALKIQIDELAMKLEVASAAPAAVTAEDIALAQKDISDALILAAPVLPANEPVPTPAPEVAPAEPAPASTPTAETTVGPADVHPAFQA
jgi:hypothetical protein